MFKRIRELWKAFKSDFKKNWCKERMKLQGRTRQPDSAERIHEERISDTFLSSEIIKEHNKKIKAMMSKGQKRDNSRSRTNTTGVIDNTSNRNTNTIIALASLDDLGTGISTSGDSGGSCSDNNSSSSWSSSSGGSSSGGGGGCE